MTTPPECTSQVPEGTLKANDVPETPPEKPRRWLNRTVGGAGLTSALGDFSYETATVIMPSTSGRVLSAYIRPRSWIASTTRPVPIAISRMSEATRTNR